MAGFVIGGGTTLFLTHDGGAALRPHEDFVFGVFKILHFDQTLVATGGKQRGLVDQVGQIRARKARRTACDHRCVNVFGDRYFAHVYVQNLLAATNVRQADVDLAVKTTRTQQGFVQYIGAVGRSDHDHAGVAFKAVHFHQHLVQCLFAFVITTARA